MTDSLIKFGWFRSHSGLHLPWKLDADALSDETIAEMAKVISWKFAFGAVVGVPIGGLRLANACRRYIDRSVDERGQNYPTLIVDDVITTGASMEKCRASVQGTTVPIGFVIFSRSGAPGTPHTGLPNWIWPFFVVGEWTQSRATGLG